MSVSIHLGFVLVFRPFFEGMSHSSSQTEIGSIHSHKSQQRELSCPVSLSLIGNPSDRSTVVFGSLLALKGPFCKQRYVKEEPLGTVKIYWQLFVFIEVPGVPWTIIRHERKFRACLQCNPEAPSSA